MRIDEDTLLDYADGELSPAQQAEVAALLAQQPELQYRLDELSRLQRGLRATFDAADLLPTPRPPVWLGRGRQHSWRSPLALGASVVGALVLILWLLAPRISTPSGTLGAPTSRTAASPPAATARPAPSPVPTTMPTAIPLGALPAGPIVFALNDPGPQSCGGSVRIQIMRAGDTQPTYLANGCMPVISPDQRQIAFLKDTAVFVMNSDGSHQRQITGAGYTDHLTAPAWSPDSREIAFVGSQNDAASIYAVSADGTGLRRLIKPASDIPVDASFTTPIWSPDGRQLAFGIQTSPGSSQAMNGIFVLSGDGAQLKRLTSAHEFQVPSGWSLDGKSILYEWANPNGGNSLATLPADGGTPTVLANGLDASEAAWSPDGRRIVFVSRRDGNCEIYLLDLASGRTTGLASLPTQEYNPAWSADGQYIIFGSYALDSPRGSIYAMRADGSRLVRLVTSESGLMWSAH